MLGILRNVLAVVGLLTAFACGTSDAPLTPDDADTSSHDAATASSHDAATASSDAHAGGPDAGCADASANSTCTSDGAARAKCMQSTLTYEVCPRGCLRAAGGTDATCIGTTSAWSCGGSYGTERALDGDYYITAFGCWLDVNGVKHGDVGDNCIPGCFDTLKKSGVCKTTDTGRTCEESITWFTADAARFGCGAKVRVTDPVSGKSVIAMAIDQGPACSVEAQVKKTVLDASGRVNRALFGTDQGVVDKTLVHVVEVDGSTPLGPVK